MENSIKLHWPEINAVIFDLGGVILNLRYESTMEAFSALAGRDATKLYTQHQQDPVFDDFEMGKINAATFRNRLRELFEVEAADQQIDSAWNALLLDIPKERLVYLKKLAETKRIFLLSNTNEIHKAAFDASLKQAHGFESLDPFFEKAYYSHLVADRKPHSSIFEKVIEEQQLNPETTLFIDDSPQHLVGAKSVGLQTFHMVSSCSLLDLRF